MASAQPVICSTSRVARLALSNDQFFSEKSQFADSHGLKTDRRQGGAVPRPIACSSFSFSGVSYSTALDIIHDLGFDGVGLGVFPQLSTLTPELIRGKARYWGAALATGLRQRGLAAADVFGASEMKINDPDAERRRSARQFFDDLIELAESVDADGITILPGVEHPGQSQVSALELTARELEFRLDRARARGLRVSIEPHVGSHLDTPEKVLTLLDLVPELELTLDYAHFHVQGIPEPDIHHLLARARHFHCRGARRDTIQTDFRSNTIDFDGILVAMEEHGYSGWIEVEYVYWPVELGGEVCDNLREARHFLEYLRSEP